MPERMPMSEPDPEAVDDAELSALVERYEAEEFASRNRHRIAMISVVGVIVVAIAGFVILGSFDEPDTDAAELCESGTEAATDVVESAGGRMSVSEPRGGTDADCAADNFAILDGVSFQLSASVKRVDGREAIDNRCASSDPDVDAERRDIDGEPVCVHTSRPEADGGVKLSSMYSDGTVTVDVTLRAGDPAGDAPSPVPPSWQKGDTIEQPQADAAADAIRDTVVDVHDAIVTAVIDTL